jgi:hypothetical protein
MPDKLPYMFYFPRTIYIIVHTLENIQKKNAKQTNATCSKIFQKSENHFEFEKRKLKYHENSSKNPTTNLIQFAKYRTRGSLATPLIPSSKAEKIHRMTFSLQRCSHQRAVEAARLFLASAAS